MRKTNRQQPNLSCIPIHRLLMNSFHLLSINFCNSRTSSRAIRRISCASCRSAISTNEKLIQTKPFKQIKPLKNLIISVKSIRLSKIMSRYDFIIANAMNKANRRETVRRAAAIVSHIKNISS